MLTSPYRTNQFSFVTHEARDAWQHGANATGWAHVYGQLKPGPFHGRMAQAWLGLIQLQPPTRTRPGCNR
jgi:hypothetical protein